MPSGPGDCEGLSRVRASLTSSSLIRILAKRGEEADCDDDGQVSGCDERLQGGVHAAAKCLLKSSAVSKSLRALPSWHMFRADVFCLLRLT